MHRRRTLFHGARNGGTAPDRSFARVFTLTRDRVVTVDANGKLGEAPHTLAGEHLQTRLRRQRLLPPRLHARLGHGGPGLF